MQEGFLFFTGGGPFFCPYRRPLPVESQKQKIKNKQNQKNKETHFWVSSVLSITHRRLLRRHLHLFLYPLSRPLIRHL